MEFLIYGQAVTVKPGLASYLLWSEQVVDLLSLTCLHSASMLQCEHTDLSLSSNLATQIKGKKKINQKKKSSFSVFDDESTHPQMRCSLNIAFNHPFSNCGICSDYILKDETIHFATVLTGVLLMQHVFI